MNQPDPTSGMSALKLALLAQRLRGENSAVALLQAEPIAIVGLGCRFPGGADSPASFWELLRAGVDAVRQVPAERWDVQAYYDPDPDAPGKMTTRYGAFLERVDTFDAEFFGIAPREARRMDPQQRLLLEVAWEALEHANLPTDQLAGSATGVFMGSCALDFGLVQYTDPEQLDAYASLGVAHSVLANRLSYALDLLGPSLAVDTACSSSLVTVHLACQSLRARECDLALAGGVNLMLLPEGMIALSRARMLAPDGRCKTFDARADGYVRGEGCGVVVLKRLSDALRDGDTIWAVVRGSAVNQDGKSNGLTAPNVLAQEAVLRAALAAAQVGAESVGYIEAHGTGTALGDPIEVQALSAVYGQPRADGAACWLGSVKTNLGHLEGAAGIAGLIKAVLALRHGAIPAHLHFHTLNPSISLSGTPFVIPTATTAWPATSEPRRAGVSAFGFGGTNAHVILEEAPALPAVTVGDGEPDVAQVLTLSARSAGALGELAARTGRRLRELDAREWAGAAASSHQGRRAFGQRLAVVANSPAQAAERLARWAASGAAGVQSQSAPRVAYVFPGQGVSLAGVGRELAERYDVFRDTLAGCAAVLQAELGADLRDVLWAEDGTALAARRAETAFVQPALVALEWALSAQLRAWGLRPSVVLGHSVGEYTAAMVAGALDWTDGLRLAAARGRLMQALPAGGGMLGLEAGEAWVGELLARLGSPAVIAAVNGPARVVVAGDVAALDAVEQACRGAGLGSQRLAVGHGFHSPLMRPMVGAYRQALESIDYQSAQIMVASGQWGRLLQAGEMLDAEYWAAQVERPVRYGDGVAALKAHGIDVVVEVGPGGQLSGLGQLAWGAGDAASWVTMRRGKADEREELLGAVGALWAAGVEVNWRALDGPGWWRIALPTYPFQRQSFPIERPASARSSAPALAELPLLGRRLPTALPATLFESTFSDQHPLLRDHHLYDTLVVPGAVYLSMALSAAGAALGSSDCTLEDFSFREPLLIEPHAAVSVQTILSRQPGDTTQLQIFSGAAPGGEWRLHCEGVIRSGGFSDDGAMPVVDRAAVRARCAETLSGEQFYAFMAKRATSLGPGYRWVEQLHRRTGEALARLRPPTAPERAGGYRLQPGLLDAGLQVFGATWPNDARDPVVYVPVGVDRLRFREPGGEAAWCYARLWPEQSGGVFAGDVTLLAEDGRVLAEITGLRVMAARSASLLRSLETRIDDWLYQVRWHPLNVAADAKPLSETGSWLILCDATGVGDALAQRLTERGVPWRLVRRDQIDLKTPQALLDLLAAHEAAAAACRTVICLWALDEPADGDPLVSAAACCSEVVRVVQALARLREPPRLWLITRQAQAVLPQEPVIAADQAALWGLGRSIAQELPDAWGGLIDLNADQHTAADVMINLMEHTSEDQVALRGGQWYAAGLERATTATASQPLVIYPDGLYLVTGGLGAVGLALARWLVARGARRLALVSRQAAPSPATAALEQQGASVLIERCDVTNADELARLLARAEFADVRGIIHAAGSLDDGALLQLTPERLQTVLAPKVLGAWQLHQLTRERPLDFFVLCSSSAALLGSAGQANYAAANAFLDGLAHARRAMGLPGLSVNWGPFASAGMAARALDAHPRGAIQGLAALELDQAGPILERLLAQGMPQAAVLRTHARDLSALGATRSSLVHTAARPVGATPPPSVTLSADLTRRLAEAHPAQRTPILLAVVTEQAAAALALDPSQSLDPRRPLREYGLDSLMALDLASALSRLSGHKLPATIVYEHPTVEMLAAYLAKELGVQPLAPSPTINPQQAAAIAEVQRLSEQELDAFVAETLDALTDPP